MQFLCLHQSKTERRHSRFHLAVPSSVHPSVSPFVCHQSREYSILKTNAPVLLKIGTSGVWGKEKKQLTSESKVKVSGITTAPADPVSQGAREGRGALVPTPQIFFHDIVVGYASSCLWAQHNLLWIVRLLGRGPMTMFCSPCRGGGEFVVTPLVKVTGVRKMTNLWRQYLQNWWVSFSANWHKCGQQGKGMKCSTLAVWSSKPHDAVIRFGDLAEASFLTPLCWICFLVLICVFMVFTCLDVMYFRI